MDRLIQEDIKNDYLKRCVAAYSTIQVDIEHIDEVLVKKPVSEFNQVVNEGIIEDIIVRLGQVGEQVFKYLLKIKHTQINPGHNYEAFQRQAIFKRGSIRNLKTSGYISEKEMNEILSFPANNSLFHNYNYLSLIVQYLLKETYKEINLLFRLSVQSQYIKEIINDEIINGEISEATESPYFEALLCPFIYDIESTQEHNLDETALKIIQKGKEAGDSFTRFRYFSNNQADQISYSIQDMFDINYFIGVLINFTKNVYNNYNDLNMKAEYIHAKTMALKYENELDRTENEINVIFNEYDDESIKVKVNKLMSNYTLEELENINYLCDKYNLKKEFVFNKSTTPKFLLQADKYNKCDEKLKEQAINYYYQYYCAKSVSERYDEYYDNMLLHEYDDEYSKSFRDWRNQYYDTLHVIGKNDTKEEKTEEENLVEEELLEDDLYNNYYYDRIYTPNDHYYNYYPHRERDLNYERKNKFDHNASNRKLDKKYFLYGPETYNQIIKDILEEKEKMI